MLKRIFAIAAAAAFGLAGAATAAQARAQAPPRAVAHLPHLRVVNLRRAYEAHLGHTMPGKIAVIMYPRGAGRVRQGARRPGTACTEPNCPLVYHGGAVQLKPRVYLLLWGPAWTTNRGEEASAAYLERFYSGLGVGPKDIWSGLTSQYGDSKGHPAFTGSVFGGFLQDVHRPPTGVTRAKIAAEADAAAARFGIKDLANAQIVVATQSGTCPQGFVAASCSGPKQYCAYHSVSHEAFINLPYLPDAGPSCGQNSVNTGGVNDEWSLIGGDAYADTITDPVPPTGWVDTADTSGGEVAGKCARQASSPVTDMALSTGPFAMQSLYSNKAGGCAMSVKPLDTLTIKNPGNPGGTVGGKVSLRLSGTSSGGWLITWFATGLPAGLSLDSHNGLVTGTLTTPGTSTVGVAAVDETGRLQTTAFSWTVSGPGKPITGDHGKCLDDSRAFTTNGNKVDVWNCNATGAQNWTFSHGALSVLGKCVDDVTQGGGGAKLVIWTCNGNPAQTWTHPSNGEYVLKLNGLCMTDPSGSSKNGTQVVLHVCHDFADQKWAGP